MSETTSWPLNKRTHALGTAGLAILVDLSQAVISLNHGREAAETRSNLCFFFVAKAINLPFGDDI